MINVKYINIEICRKARLIVFLPEHDTLLINWALTTSLIL